MRDSLAKPGSSGKTRSTENLFRFPDKPNEGRFPALEELHDNLFEEQHTFQRNSQLEVASVDQESFGVPGTFSVEGSKFHHSPSVPHSICVNI